MTASENYQIITMCIFNDYSLRQKMINYVILSCKQSENLLKP